jgi:hypothetical protein
MSAICFISLWISTYLHVSRNIVGNNGQQVVGVGLLKVPEDGKVAAFTEQRLFASFIPSDIIASFLQGNRSIKPVASHTKRRLCRRQH